MVSGREKALMDIIKIYEEQLKSAEEKRDLVEVVFHAYHLGERAGQEGVLILIKYPKCPDGVDGEHLFVPREEVSPSHPWFVPV
jgi:hypothetical protein